MTHLQSIPTTTRLLKAVLMAGTCCLTLAAAVPVQAKTSDWQPDASERLVRLPADYMQQAIKQDYANSELATNLSNVNKKIKQTSNDLSELQKTMDQADDEKVRRELQHQFLAKKKKFIELMGKRQKLEHKQAKTHLELYRQLLDQIESKNGARTAAEKELIQKQKKARKRFESVVDKVDMKMFGSAASKKSEYNKEYKMNMKAIEKMGNAIRNHPMNSQAEIDGQKVSKKEYIRQLMAEKESDLAILDQGEQILGYMAKLVALDAMALAANVGNNKAVAKAETPTEGMRARDAANFFVDQ